MSRVMTSRGWDCCDKRAVYLGLFCVLPGLVVSAGSSWWPDERILILLLDRSQTPKAEGTEDGSDDGGPCKEEP